MDERGREMSREEKSEKKREERSSAVRATLERVLICMASQTQWV